MFRCVPATERHVGCNACSDKNYASADQPIPVAIYRLEIGSGGHIHTNAHFCAGCLQDLHEAIHPFRSGAVRPAPRLCHCGEPAEPDSELCVDHFAERALGILDEDEEGGR